MSDTESEQNEQRKADNTDHGMPESTLFRDIPLQSTKPKKKINK